ncbi:ribokinase [Novosphingobium endophyticum]|uniref:Ribokinase n=1 Tax=Novosphingobium endophyticum TaxID=1955250 RepID=A0A916X5U6_9SPHN|nr:ribokinase [Novosphingobium endophyticum]GGC12296.1 ribokinase [Novosphingobium endophyticum]
MKIAIVGSINADIVINVREFAAPNETVISEQDYVLSDGGKGANQAAAVAAAGAEASFIARIGDDELGNRAIANLVQAGVNCEFVSKTPHAATGLAAILVNRHGDNIISVAAGANAHLTAADISAAESSIAQADAIIVQLEVPLQAVEAAIRVARAHGVKVVLNPAPAPEAALTFLGDVDVLIPNESEARYLAALHGAEDASLENAARALLSAGARNVVVTLGADGCLLATAEGLRHIPPYPVEAVDTTGAGDVFCAFLTAALIRGAPLAAAVDEASAAAALSVTRPQARKHLPTAAEVMEFKTARP